MTNLHRSQPLPPLRLSKGAVLADWQSAAVEGWRRSFLPGRGPRHGIIEAVTGTGKTLAAIACMVDAVGEVPALRIAVVVPGQALALQWQRELCRWLDLPPAAVGVRMAGHSDRLRDHRVVVWVIDTARDHLAADCAGLDVMLVVDECHRSGSAANLRIYRAKTRFRLGLSATAHRQREVDENGMLVPLEGQSHARELGPTVPPKVTVALAEKMGILPPFRLVHHGLELSDDEGQRYQWLTKKVSTAIADASNLGLSAGAIFSVIRSGPGGKYSAQQVNAAKAVQTALLARKHFLYRRLNGRGVRD